jgi:hypothetical protein
MNVILISHESVKDLSRICYGCDMDMIWMFYGCDMEMIWM